MQIYLTKTLALQFEEYRKRRRLETGKIIQRQTAVYELLSLALAGITPTATISADEIAVKLKELDDKIDRLDKFTDERLGSVVRELRNHSHKEFAHLKEGGYLT